MIPKKVLKYFVVLFFCMHTKGDVAAQSSYESKEDYFRVEFPCEVVVDKLSENNNSYSCTYQMVNIMIIVYYKFGAIN